MQLQSGYSKPEWTGTRTFRAMTFDECAELHYGRHIQVKNFDGKVVTVKVNGEPKRWKRDTTRMEIPCKFGLRECFTIYFYAGVFSAGCLPVCEVKLSDLTVDDLAGELSEFA